MTGRTLIIGFFSLLAAFAGALWYFQTYAYYVDLPKQALVIGDQTYPVENWEGIEATSSPLKLRACLTLSDEVLEQITRDQEPSDGAIPLVAPNWFECFDARSIGADLEAGTATPFALASIDSPGIDAWLAVYADGRAYKWHQLKPEFTKR